MHDFQFVNQQIKQNMKKLFLALMLVAVVAAGFMGCEKNTSDSENHSQTFTLGETEFAIDNAISILNIQYQGSDVYNTIILSHGNMIGETGGEGQGVVILFKGDITTGTYYMSEEEEAYPKYFIGQVGIEDIVNFDIENYENNEDAYMAITGSFTLEDVDGKYVITTDGIEVINYKDNTLEASSVDFEGETNDFVLATVLEGTLNHEEMVEPIVTAGTTHINLELLGIVLIDDYVACFITEEGNFIGFKSDHSLADVPVGTFTNDDYTIIYAEGMDITNIKDASEGEISITESEGWYTVNIHATINDIEYTLHYVGTIPNFDFPFSL